MLSAFSASALFFSTPIGRPSFRQQPFVGLARVWFHTIRRENAVIGFSAPLIADPIRVSAAMDCFAAWQRPGTLQVDNTHADRLDPTSGGRGPSCTCRTPTFIRMSPREASSVLSMSFCVDRYCTLQTVRGIRLRIERPESLVDKRNGIDHGIDIGLHSSRDHDSSRCCPPRFAIIRDSRPAQEAQQTDALLIVRSPRPFSCTIVTLFGTANLWLHFDPCFLALVLSRSSPFCYAQQMRCNLMDSRTTSTMEVCIRKSSSTTEPDFSDSLFRARLTGLSPVSLFLSACQAIRTILLQMPRTIIVDPNGAPHHPSSGKPV